MMSLKYLPKPLLRRRFIVGRGIRSIRRFGKFWKGWELIAVIKEPANYKEKTTKNTIFSSEWMNGIGKI